MSLQKVKRDLNNLKKDIGNKEEPTLQNFFKFCEGIYGRRVHCGEIWNMSYYIDGEQVEPNPILFAQLSEKYYTEIHGVKNPVKDGERGLKSILVLYWREKYHKDEDIILKNVMDDPDYNAWYEDAWNSIINEGSFKKVEDIYEGMD